ncbi:HpcH/HpaI aldolase family protein [Pseudooceanicola marinus]|uniref:HpcH/HpaI aldolase family protein n=1 Tax=Pseudooceanicola marinus TaxID=396013 RepID=UPI001CD32F1F|nr:aldolase/citrate lyase family protein [Pseudooceanicola marinus]MCA1336164.1 aldolase [Pseudooceanicola marinus]
MTLRDRLTAPDARLRGIFQDLPSPAVTEVLCLAGVDFLCADSEHSSFRGEVLSNVLRAAGCHDTPVLVRVADAVPHLIAEALDAGAAGVMVPRVSDAETARACVAAARFPPQGVRGAGPGRGAGYGYRMAEVIEAPAPLIGVQVETLGALDTLEEILAIEGLDYLMIGPADLGLALRAGRPDLSLDAAIVQVRDACAAARMPLGIFAADRAAGDAALDWAQFVLQGTDAMLLAAATEAAFR